MDRLTKVLEEAERDHQLFLEILAARDLTGFRFVKVFNIKFDGDLPKFVFMSEGSYACCSPDTAVLQKIIDFLIERMPKLKNYKQVFYEDYLLVNSDLSESYDVFTMRPGLCIKKVRILKDEDVKNLFENKEVCPFYLC